jgi:hypothetical protein
MNQTQLAKKIIQFLRKKLTKAELKEMGIKPRSLILTIRNLIERYLLIILDSIFVDVPRGWDNFFYSFYCWQKLILKNNKSIREIYFWEPLNNYKE